jgi:hypothetical protein
MSEDAWPKVGASMGIVAAILFIIGFVVGPSGSPPGFNDSAKEVQSYIQENRGEIQAAMTMGFAVLVAVAWFLGSVYFRLRAAETEARLSVVALAGGIVVLAAATAGSAAEAAAAYHVNTLDANTVQGLWDLSLIAFLFVWAGFAVLAGASAALAIRTKVLPDWLCFYDAAAAVYVFVIGVIGMFSETGAFSPSDGGLQLIGFIVWIVWLLATGIVLFREPRAVAPGSRPSAAAPPPATPTTPA